MGNLVADVCWHEGITESVTVNILLMIHIMVCAAHADDFEDYALATTTKPDNARLTHAPCSTHNPSPLPSIPHPHG